LQQLAGVFEMVRREEHKRDVRAGVPAVRDALDHFPCRLRGRFGGAQCRSKPHRRIVSRSKRHGKTTCPAACCSSGGEAESRKCSFHAWRKCRINADKELRLSHVEKLIELPGGL